MNILHFKSRGVLVNSIKRKIYRLGGSDGKASVYNAGDRGSIPGLGRSPGKEMATHSSTLAWRIPWREEPGKVQSSPQGRKESDTTELLHFHFKGRFCTGLAK